jgi:alpha-tubulin suppressor-like RCC1 family protein
MNEIQNQIYLTKQNSINEKLKEILSIHYNQSSPFIRDFNLVQNSKIEHEIQLLDVNSIKTNVNFQQSISSTTKSEIFMKKKNEIKILKKKNMKVIQCGGGSSYILFLENGELFSCGWNSYGELGLNDFTHRNTFHRVAFNKRIIQITGFEHILVLTGLYFLSVPVLIFCF